MALATTLMAVGIPAEQANRLGYEDRVPLDGNGTTQAGATEIIATNTNVAAGTSVGDTAFILPADAEYFQPYFVLNSTPEPALIFPPVGDTIDANAVDAAVEIEEDLARVFQRVEEGRWVSFPAGEGGGGIDSIVAGTGIAVDNTDPDNPVISNTGVLSVSSGAGISVDVTDPQNPIVINTGVLSVTAGSNITIGGTAQNPTINGNAGTVTAVSIASANGFAGSSSGGATPQLTVSTTITGILQGNGTAISAASTTGTGNVVLATSPTLSTNVTVPVVIGGTAAGSSLSLQSTSGVGSGDFVRFIMGNNGASEVARFTTTNGSQLLMGTTTSTTIMNEVGVGSTLIPNIQVQSGGTVGIGVYRWAANNVGPRSAFVKSRGSVGSNVIVQNGDMIGTFVFDADDGSAFPTAAYFGAYVDGAPGASDMPGRLVFGTTPDGSVTPAEWLRITSTGQITHRGNATVIVDASSHLGLRSYTVATLPSAATAARLIYVSDGTSNKRLAVSDGTNWRWPDGAIVS
jgi:hypothetical protein